MHLLAISGSLREQSYNGMLLGQAEALLPGGVDCVQWHGLHAVPPFSEDHEGAPAPVVRHLRATVAAADAVLVATPEYNGSVPGQLKNALDWASRPFPDNVLRGKPAAVVGASITPSGAGRAQAEVRAVLGRIGAEVLDTEVRVARAAEQFDQEGRLIDTELRRALADLLGGLVAAVRGRAPRAATRGLAA